MAVSAGHVLLNEHFFVFPTVMRMTLKNPALCDHPQKISYQHVKLNYDTSL